MKITSTPPSVFAAIFPACSELGKCESEEVAQAIMRYRAAHGDAWIPVTFEQVRNDKSHSAFGVLSDWHEKYFDEVNKLTDTEEKAREFCMWWDIVAKQYQKNLE
jgi:hypothetical protein